MQKNYGLFYSKPDDSKKYLYRSYYTLEELQHGLESKEFKSIDTDKVTIVKLEVNKEIHENNN